MAVTACNLTYAIRNYDEFPHVLHIYIYIHAYYTKYAKKKNSYIIYPVLGNDYGARNYIGIVNNNDSGNMAGSTGTTAHHPRIHLHTYGTARII
jgi:hypothetical protein